MLNVMRHSTKVALVAAVSFAGPAVAAGPVFASAVRPATNCSWSPVTDSNVPGVFQAEGVNIRSGPSTSCNVIYGEGYPGQTVAIRCGVSNLQGQVWFYISDYTTGVTGWSEAPLAQINGPYSVAAC